MDNIKSVGSNIPDYIKF